MFALTSEAGGGFFDLAQWALVVLFVVAYGLISSSHIFHWKKEGWALLFNGAMWLVVAMNEMAHDLEHEKELSIAEAGDIAFFLLFAMIIVETLAHHRFFDLIAYKLLRKPRRKAGLFIIVCVGTAVMSCVFDNMTSALVMTRLMGQFLDSEDMLVFGAGISGSANILAAASVIGDITSLMIWRAGKITPVQLIVYAGPASVANLVTYIYLLKRRLNSGQELMELEMEKPRIYAHDKFVNLIGVLGFATPVFFFLNNLPPFMGLMTTAGLLLVVLAVRHKQHASNKIEEILIHVDLLSIGFLVGLLFLVFALRAGGVLQEVSLALLGSNPSFVRVAIICFVLGLWSAVVDNVPLTAIAILILTTEDPLLWGFLAYCVGTGGNLLLIGTVAGIVMAGQIMSNKRLTTKMDFGKYMRIATIPAAAAYTVGALVWAAEAFIIVKFIR